MKNNMNIPNVMSGPNNYLINYETRFVELMADVITKCGIDPEEAPQLMRRVWCELELAGSEEY